MTGRVKDHFWEEIEQRAAEMPPEPDPPEDTETLKLELLKMDALQSIARYRAARKEQHGPR